MAISERVALPAPKKLLALDGGGIRGIVTIEVLAQIEAMLRRETEQPELRLADYFDYIAGTSTGAIIAAALAIGLETSELRTFYEECGEAMFLREPLWRRFTSHKYQSRALSAKLQELFGHSTTLGSNSLRTLLMMVMRNATTDTPWVVSNNRFAKFNDPQLPECNLRLPLWQLVRASAAAPAYFEPQRIRLADRPFLFVDGGITAHNNPAFQLFLMATLAPYRLCWPTGERRMLLVSVGTGHTPTPPPSDRGLNLLNQARLVPAALMSAARREQDRLCRIFGCCLEGDPLNAEMGNLHGVPAPGGEKMFTYLRYDAELNRQRLAQLGLAHVNPDRLGRLDAVEQVAALRRLGRDLATRVNAEHYRGFLDNPHAAPASLPLRARASG